ncbi:MAG: hypothetical protein ACFCBW_23155, partial [Candidatus Competibacterales bacterium]
MANINTTLSQQSFADYQLHATAQFNAPSPCMTQAPQSQGTLMQQQMAVMQQMLQLMQQMLSNMQDGQGCGHGPAPSGPQPSQGCGTPHL